MVLRGARVAVVGVVLGRIWNYCWCRSCGGVHMTITGSFPKMWRSWGDGKKIVAILDLSLFIVIIIVIDPV